MRHHEETLSTVEPIYVNPNGGLASPLKEKQMMFSLFYFSTVDELLDANKYALLICKCTGRGVVRTIILLQVKRRRTIE